MLNPDLFQQNQLNLLLPQKEKRCDDSEIDKRHGEVSPDVKSSGQRARKNGLLSISIVPCRF